MHLLKLLTKDAFFIKPCKGTQSIDFIFEFSGFYVCPILDGYTRLSYLYQIGKLRRGQSTNAYNAIVY